MNLPLAIPIAFLLATALDAQCSSMTTASSTAFYSRGTMFDIVNVSASPIEIGSFDQWFTTAGSSQVRIYTKSGTWSGSETNPQAWTPIGTVLAMGHFGGSLLDHIPLPVDVVIAPGASQAFYIVAPLQSTGRMGIAYTAPPGTVIQGNGTIQLKSGVHTNQLFGSIGMGLSPNTGVRWCGRINYCTPGVGTSLATAQPVGSGCGLTYDAFYQLFPDATAASAALEGGTLMLSPRVDGYQGSWAPDTAASLFHVPVNPTVLNVGNDNSVAIMPTHPTPTPYGSMSWFRVGGNGTLTFGHAAPYFGGYSSWIIMANNFLASTTGGFYAWHDHNVEEPGSGPVVWEDNAGGTLYVTFDDVESYSMPAGVNRSTVQFQVDTTGEVRIVFLEVDDDPTSSAGSATLVGVTAPGPVAFGSPIPASINLATATGHQLYTSDAFRGPLTLRSLSRPIQSASGGDWTFELSEVPPGVLGLDIIGLSDPMILNLHALALGDLDCQLRASIDLVTGPWVEASDLHTWAFTVPTSPVLNGMPLLAQSIVLPELRLRRTLSSNGMLGIIGDH